VLNFILRKFFQQYIFVGVCFAFIYLPSLYANDVKAKVQVIIDKLPLDKQDRMRNFHEIVKKYVEESPWLEAKDQGDPIEISLQLFLTDLNSNVEDRYKCEFLVSGSDVQYFDRRVRFPFQPGEQLVFNEQSVGPLTGVINFYVYMIIANEFDKYNKFGGDIYYKKAQNMAALGKFVRSEFILGWTEREEIIDRIFTKEFKTFRVAKDHFFYGLYVKDDNISEARKNIVQAIDLIDAVLTKKSYFEEPQQFLNAHYMEIIDLFKNTKNHSELFKKLIKLDQDHKKQYAKFIPGS